MKNRTQTGFTLYELLTTMLIVGVVLSLGIPNMQSFRLNSRMTAAANDLHSSFHLARSEAARAKNNISICASADSSLATPVCSGGFEAGWVVFEDRNADLVVDDGEPILRRYPAMNTDITIKTVDTGPDDYFMYASTGLGRRDLGGKVPVSVMVMCDPRGNVTGGGGKSTARVLIVTPLGRAAVLGDKAQVAAQDGGC
jgi:type IV fimbrial biogenesis protein FimT